MIFPLARVATTGDLNVQDDEQNRAPATISAENQVLAQFL